MPFTGGPPRAGITRLCCRMLRCRKPRPGEARVLAPARCRGRRGPRKTVQAQERAGSGSAVAFEQLAPGAQRRSEEHTSELQSLMRISYAVFCLKKTKQDNTTTHITRVILT